MGKKSPVWEHWTELSGGSHPRAKCNYCFKEYERAFLKRLKDHLGKKCPNVPNNVKSQFFATTQAPRIENFSSRINHVELTEAYSAEGLFNAKSRSGRSSVN